MEGKKEILTGKGDLICVVEKINEIETKHPIPLLKMGQYRGLRQGKILGQWKGRSELLGKVKGD